MISLSKPAKQINSLITLSGSKSISNRLLLINEILGLNLNLKNLSVAEDTILLQKAIKQLNGSAVATIDIHHAGTDMRFLTAYLSVIKGEWILTGSERMKNRPVGELVNALRQLGAEIYYLEKENFPPLKIIGKILDGGALHIDSSVSSQFISALILVAPSFKNGLELTLKNKPVSMPYIQMTIALLQKFGITIHRVENKISFSNPPLVSSNINLYSEFSIESDWSSASYWYSICALSPGSKIELRSLNEKSLQADSVLPKLFECLGVNSVFKKASVILQHKKTTLKSFSYDFTDCPDIAQTLIVTCFALGLAGEFTGLQTLKLKESDRIKALKIELEKFGAAVSVTDNSFLLAVSNAHLLTEAPIISTYNDHRMAMSFAPLALIYPNLKIEDESVVSKSYPLFWEDLKSVGFNVTLQP